MPRTYHPPDISVRSTLDGGFRLFASSYGRTEIAGERLFRAEPWPDVAWTHATRAEAEADAATLRSYLQACAEGKLKERESRRGWWQ